MAKSERESLMLTFLFVIIAAILVFLAGVLVVGAWAHKNDIKLSLKDGQIFCNRKD